MPEHDESMVGPNLPAAVVESPTIPHDLVGMLDLLAQTIVQALGFGVAAINITRVDGLLEVVAVAGDAGARAALLGSVDTPERWGKMLASSEHWGRLRYSDHRHALASADLLTWIPDIVPVDAEDSWHPEDALFAPLTAEDGSLLGVMSVDLPHDGLRPDETTCSTLEAFAVSAALAIEHATLRARSEASEQMYRRLSMIDPLTGLGNRSVLVDHLRRASSSPARPRPLMALLFVDIDRFKSINDNYSHETGDRVLQEVADRLCETLGPRDLVVRWGGDEFIMLLDSLQQESDALDVVHRVRRIVSESIHVEGRALQVTVSVGVSFRSATDEIDVDEMVGEADTAMFRAKRTGRNAGAVFDELDVSPSARARIVKLLARAVDEDRVVVHFQPLVRTSDQVIVGMEALTRLRDDDGSLLQPDTFLAIASDNGFLIGIEQEVMRQACERAAGWKVAGYDVSVSVNVCAEHLDVIGDFEQLVRSTLHSTNLPARKLVVELTEHTLLQVNPQIFDGVTRLASDGVRFSIDDFGTGFGSMTYLHCLPIHELKIDRSFIAAALDDPRASAIVASVAGLAGTLGLECVAEGVETLEQHLMVRDAGAHLGQGFFYRAADDPACPEALLKAYARRS